MVGVRARGYAPLLGSFDNSPNDRASVSAFCVGALRSYWRSLLALLLIGPSLITIFLLPITIFELIVSSAPQIPNWSRLDE
jgi:hypothetical protein